MIRTFSLLFFCFLLSFHTYAQSDLKAGYLRCEYKINPVTDVANPRLSWELTSAVNSQYQTGYQILAATSVALLEEGKADLWDSKKEENSAMGNPQPNILETGWRFRD